MGIVVPFSWSFWGAVVEHAELQAAALRELGHDVRLVMGNDPPGQFTRALHPRVGRHGEPPPEVIPIGRSVIVPANGSLPNIILSPRSIFRIRRVLERERFDVLHLHEPMTPTPCIAALAFFDGPMVGTHHASGDLGWMRLATPVWGFLEERLDRRIAVSEQARASAQRWLPGEYEIVPNGVLIPEGVEPGGREHRIVFAGRQEPRKGLQVLLRAWPEIRRRTGARLRIAGADPLAVRLLLTRLRVSDDGIDVLGFLSAGRPDGGAQLGEGARRAVARRGELRDGADARVRVRDAGRRIRHPRLPRRDDARDVGRRHARRPARRSPRRSTSLLADEPGRVALGEAARQLAIERYSWQDIAPAARANLRRGARHERAADGGGVRYVPRSPWLRASLGLPLLVVVGVLLWWRGPDWNVVYHAFDLVNWAWVVVRARAQSRLRARPLARVAADDRPGARPAAARASARSSRRSRSACSATRCCPAGSASSRGWPCCRRHLPRGAERVGTLVGTVFAHRLFDLLAALLLVLYVAMTAKIPHWAVTSLVIVVDHGRSCSSPSRS